MSRRPPDQAPPSTIRLLRGEWQTFAACCVASRSMVGAGVAKAIGDALRDDLAGECLSIERDCDKWSAAIRAAGQGAILSGKGFGVLAEVTRQNSEARHRAGAEAVANYRAPYPE